MSATCWLCEYNNDPEAMRLGKFLADNAPHMGIEQLTNAIYERLNMVDPNGMGHEKEDIRNHIQTHVLTPSVKISCVLRALIQLLDKLENGLLSTGDDNITIIDAKNVGVYLKIVSEVMSIYKNGDCNKLMFGDVTHSTSMAK
jgi:hypothetical protein